MFNLQRLLVERIEHRILVGTVAFLLVMVLVGWIAINEGGRMQAFERQYNARSIERGAAMFVTYCSECHNTDGRGYAGVAPGLNSPYLFGHDYLGEIDTEVTSLTAERDAAGTTDARRAEIDTRLAELQTQRDGIVASLQPAIDRGYNVEDPSRLANVGWTSTTYSFIFTTLVHGRPNSGSYWPRAMPAWSQTAGASLRDDQLQDITNFILNWDKGEDWTIEDANAVAQYPRVAVEDTGVAALPEGVEVIGVETPTETVVAEVANFVGDPVNGQNLYNGALACSGCHLNAAVAPPTEGTWTRVQNERLTLPEYAGWTGEAYLAQSITHPNEFIAPGYLANVMPPNFADRLTYQDLADLIAYLRTQEG